jgi:osmotically-inducible protein OsmY
VTRISWAVVALTAAVGCSADTSTQPQGTQVHQAQNSVPRHPADRAISRDLTLAITRDLNLKDRDISFIVTNGDVNVTGTVRTEDERKRINELAMNISGVKSVANALRVSP